MSKRKFGELQFVTASSMDKKPKLKREPSQQIPVKLIKQLATREIKYRDTYLTNTNLVVLSGTGTWGNSSILLGNLAHVPLGDEISQRTGRKISINSVRLRISLVWTALTDSLSFVTPSPVRLILAQDKQCNGAFPNQTQYEEILTRNGPLAVMNPQCFGRYKMLQDKYFEVPAPSGNLVTTSGQNYFPGVHQFVKMKYNFKNPLIVNYNSQTTGDVRDIVDNNIFLCGCTSTSTTGVVPVTVNIMARISYTDM